MVDDGDREPGRTLRELRAEVERLREAHAAVIELLGGENADRRSAERERDRMRDFVRDIEESIGEERGKGETCGDAILRLLQERDEARAEVERVPVDAAAPCDRRDRAGGRVMAPVYMRLPHDETDTHRRYSMADPDACAEALVSVYRWLHYGEREPTREELLRVLAMADGYSVLTTYELGQEHCVAKLRHIWRARRARAEEGE